MSHGGVRVGEADGFEPFAGRLVGQRDLVVVHACADRQHRAVVDVQMQPSDFASRLIVAFDELFGMQAEHACEPSEFHVVVQRVEIDIPLAFKTADAAGPQIGEQVGAFEFPHLLTMFEHALEPVVLGEFHGLLTRDVPAVRERFERVQRAAFAQCRVGTPVHQLQHLHGEFDVPEPAPTEFDFPVFEIVGDEPFDTLTHLLAVLDEIVVFGCGPDERAGHVKIGLCQLFIACGGTGFEQRLEFPVLRPLLVIRAVRFETPDQWAVLAFRSQTAIDLP